MPPTENAQAPTIPPLDLRNPSTSASQDPASLPYNLPLTALISEPVGSSYPFFAYPKETEILFPVNNHGIKLVHAASSHFNLFSAGADLQTTISDSDRNFLYRFYDNILRNAHSFVLPSNFRQADVLANQRTTNPDAPYLTRAKHLAELIRRVNADGDTALNILLSGRITEPAPEGRIYPHMTWLAALNTGALASPPIRTLFHHTPGTEEIRRVGLPTFGLSMSRCSVYSLIPPHSISLSYLIEPDLVSTICRALSSWGGQSLADAFESLASDGLEITLTINQPHQLQSITFEREYHTSPVVSRANAGIYGFNSSVDVWMHQSGHLCMGDQGAAIRSAVNRGDFFTTQVILNKLYTQYNPRGPYYHIHEHLLTTLYSLYRLTPKESHPYPNVLSGLIDTVTYDRLNQVAKEVIDQQFILEPATTIQYRRPDDASPTNVTNPHTALFLTLLLDKCLCADARYGPNASNESPNFRAYLASDLSRDPGRAEYTRSLGGPFGIILNQSLLDSAPTSPPPVFNINSLGNLSAT